MLSKNNSLRAVRRILFLLLACLCAFSPALATAADTESGPLPSWNNTAAKEAIIKFVQSVTKEGPGYVAPAERIAAFDFDGTLVPEQPSYYQNLFSLEVMKQEAAANEKWSTEPIYKDLLAGNLDLAIALNEKKANDFLLGLTATKPYAKLEGDIWDWLESAHPDSRFDGHTYGDLTYKPMQELMAYLKENNFKIYIVSGSEMQFMRAVAKKLYSLPPEQVIGSRFKQRLEVKGSNAKLVTENKPDMLNTGDNKALNTHLVTGQIPILAFGNSDNDMPLLQWVTSAPGPRLGLLLHHTDAEREFAYDQDSLVGRLKNALKQAKANKWVVVDMKEDWTEIFEEK